MGSKRWDDWQAYGQYQSRRLPRRRMTAQERRRLGNVEDYIKEQEKAEKNGKPKTQF